MDRTTAPLYARVRDSEDRALLDEWIAAWEDLILFDVIPVMTSAEAAALSNG